MDLLSSSNTESNFSRTQVPPSRPAWTPLLAWDFMREFLEESAPNITYIGTPHTLAFADDLQKQPYQNQGHFTAAFCWASRSEDLRDGSNLDSSLSGSQVGGTHWALFLEDSSSELKLVPLP